MHIHQLNRLSAYGAPRAAAWQPQGPTQPTDKYAGSIPMPMFVVSALMRAAVAPVTVPLAGTPIQLTLNDLRWPRPAEREVESHMKDRGLRADEPLANLARVELGLARKADDRVTSQDMLRAIARSEAAQRLEPVKQNDLFAFTRLTDSKFALTTGLVDKLESLNAPDDKLIAGLDKALEGKGASAQLNLDARTADWLTRSLMVLNVPTQEAMGGAGAFCANLAACQPNVRAGFWALGGLPGKVAAGMHPAITVHDEQGRERPAAQAADLNLPDRINYIAEYRGQASGRLILSSPGTQEIGFGAATDQVLSQTIAGKRLFFFAGLHYLTKEPAKADKVADDLGAMKRYNPSCMFHLQYVNPKDPAHEKEVLDKMAPYVDSMSLNAVEVPGLLERIAPGYDGVPASADRDVMEAPGTLLDNAYRLRTAMDLDRVHLHGQFGDLVIAKTPQDRERTVLSLMKARQLAAMKATNPSGQVASKNEMWPMLPLVEGACLAAVQKFADSVQDRFGLSDAQRAQVARDWHYDDGQGNTVFFVPSRGIHDRTGGTVSLGDTIDATALIYSLE